MKFNELNTAELDMELTPEEQREWNSIYASYRAGSVLTGHVAGVDGYSKAGDNKILAAVVIPYRVKILIPEPLLWDRKDSMPENISRNILGAKIDFVIKEIDRENNFCIGSRIAGMKIMRKKFFSTKPKAGDFIKCNVLAIGQRRMMVEAGGFDIKLSQKDVCYSMTTDLRQIYSSGEILTALIKQVSSRDNKLSISIAEAKPHPYEGIKKRHPIGSRRASVITGKYKGSIFCKLESDFDCLCNYSEYQCDDDFKIGDKVIVVVNEFDDANKRVFGVIVSKWN